MREALAPGDFCDTSQALDVGELPVGDAEPAEPLGFIAAGPQ